MQKKKPGRIRGTLCALGGDGLHNYGSYGKMLRRCPRWRWRWRGRQPVFFASFLDFPVPRLHLQVPLLCAEGPPNFLLGDFYFALKGFLIEENPRESGTWASALLTAMISVLVTEDTRHPALRHSSTPVRLPACSLPGRHLLRDAGHFRASAVPAGDVRRFLPRCPSFASTCCYLISG